MLRNRIKEILQKNGWADVTPSNELLSLLGISIKMWNKWTDNSVDETKQPNGRQLVILKDYLKVGNLEELLDVSQVSELADVSNDHSKVKDQLHE